MEIKLITQSEIKDELKKIVKDAEVIKGTVAYWTWDDSFIETEFGTNYFQALNNKDSFFCIDISSPTTNIDNVATCARKANNFFIFSYRLKNKKKSDEGDISLLHSKIIYIKTLECHFVIIGSHNNTKSAYNGINMEHSVLIKFSVKTSDQEKELLNSFESELDRIKLMCQKFNLDLIDFYKRMQVVDGGLLPRVVLELNSTELNDISINQTISIITLFNIVKERDANIDNIKDRKIIVAVYDEKENLRLFSAIGEADDEVEKGQMDEKVTDSDYIALRIDGFSDLLGIPYLTFQKIRGKQIKGDVINFTNHIIQRFKLIEDIKDYDSVKEFIGRKKKISFYSESTIDDIYFHENHIHINPKSVLVIDENKHKLEYLKKEKNSSFDSKPYKINTDRNINEENRKSIKLKLVKIYEILIQSNLIESKENIFSSVLSVLSGSDKSLENITENKNKQLINDLLSKIRLNKKLKNKLRQFEDIFHHI